MNNLFDSTNYLDQEPTEVYAGDRWAWTRSDITAAYPTAAYTLSYRFTALDGTCDLVSITASKVDSAHVVEVGTATTTGYAAGEYAWSATITRDSDSEEVTVDSGVITIHPEVGEASGTAASWVYQVLVAIRAVLKDGAGNDTRRLEVGGRVVEWRSYAELIGLERDFSSRWEAEKAALDRRRGRKTRNRVLVTMSA